MLSAVGCMVLAVVVILSAPHRVDDLTRPSACDTSDSRLVRSAAEGDVDALGHELANGRDADEPDAWGLTALYCAASLDRADAVRVLLEHGADPNRITRDDQTPLAAAARRGNPDVVDDLFAAGAGAPDDPEVAAALNRPSDAPPPTAHPADPAPPSGAPPARDDVLRQFHEHGADLDPRLGQAVAAGDLTSTLTLLDAGADPNNAPLGVTPLFLATWQGDARIVSVLLDRGADPTRAQVPSASLVRPQSRSTSATPPDATPCATVPGTPPPTDPPPTEPLTPPADSGGDATGGRAPAASDEPPPSTEPTVTVTTDPCSMAGTGVGSIDDVHAVQDIATGTSNATVPLLVMAAAGGHDEAVAALLAVHLPVDGRTSAGYTALDVAAAGGHQPIVQALRTAGADTRLGRDATGGPTALGLALLTGHAALVPLLTPS